MKFVVATVAALTATASAQAQNVYHFEAPAAAQAGQAGQRFFLPAGTPISMRTLTQVSTKDNKPGDRIYLDVVEPVTFRDQVIIPAGSPVTAEVAATQRNGHFGKKGKIAVRLIEVMTPHGPVRLAGSSDAAGKSGTALSIATIAFVSTLGFLIHGTSATIPPGTLVDGQLGGDLKFTYYPGSPSAEQAMLASTDRAAAGR